MDNQSTADANSDAASAARGRLVSFAGIPRQIDINAVPLLGKPDATYVIAEMFDYTCPHCRHLHGPMLAARQRYGDQLAVVLQHVPLSTQCNDHFPPGRKGKPTACDYAYLAISVYQLAPDQFEEFHNWLMEGDHPPPIQAARKRAIAIAGDRVVFDERRKEGITQRLREQCDAWSKINPALPLLLFENAAVRGVAKTDEDLFKLLEEKLDIQPAAGN